MNLAIISGWNSGYQCLADVTIPNREFYAAKHGYKTISKCLDNVGGRSGLWAKQWLAIEAIYNFEWIWLWDIDAIVTNMELPITWLNGTADLIFSTDVNGLNCGSIFIRQSEWSIDFIKKWWKAGKRFMGWTNPDQTCLAHILYLEPKDKWDILPQKVCNSYQYEHYLETPYPNGEWTNGDFVLHLPAIPLNKRINILKKHL